MDQVTVNYEGKQITAALSEGQTTSGEVLPSDKAPEWHVTIAGTALTKFPATVRDTEEQVRPICSIAIKSCSEGDDCD